MFPHSFILIHLFWVSFCLCVKTSLRACYIIFIFTWRGFTRGVVLKRRHKITLEILYLVKAKLIEGNGYQTWQRSLLYVFCWLFWGGWPCTKPRKIRKLLCLLMQPANRSIAIMMYRSRTFQHKSCLFAFLRFTRPLNHFTPLSMVKVK